MIIIDRFENDMAVVEFNEKVYTIPKAWLPITAKEGDVIKFMADVDEQETARLRKEAERKLDDLFE